MKQRQLLLALVSALGTAPAPARASECAPPNGLSPCVDAQSMWWTTGRTRFVSVPASDVLDPHAFTTSLGLGMMWSPITLVAASPDPEGKRIDVVANAFDATMGFAYGLGYGMELGAVMPIVLRQTGTGLGAVTAQSSAPLSGSAVRDPRLSVSYLLFASGGAYRLGIVPRVTVAFPLGDETAFAGGSGFTVAPGVSFGADLGHFYVASELGVRLRETVELAGSHIGTQATASLGLSGNLLAERRIGFGAEAWMLPSLVTQNHTLPDGTRVNGNLVPAEWLATIHVLLGADKQARLFVGGGTGIPLSSRTEVATDGTTTESTELGVTTPAARLVLGVRYQPPQ